VETSGFALMIAFAVLGIRGTAKLPMGLRPRHAEGCLKNWGHEWLNLK